MNNNFIANFMTDILGNLTTQLIKFMTYHHTSHRYTKRHLQQ